MNHISSIMHKSRGFITSAVHLIKMQQSTSVEGMLYKEQIKQSVVGELKRILIPWPLFILGSKYNEFKAPFLALLFTSYTFASPRIFQSSLYIKKRFKKIEPQRRQAATVIFQDLIRSLESISTPDSKRVESIITFTRDPHLINLKVIKKLFYRHSNHLSFLSKDSEVINAYMTLYGLRYKFLFPKTRLLKMFSRLSAVDALAKNAQFTPTTAYNMLTERVRELGPIEPHYTYAVDDSAYLPLGMNHNQLKSKYKLYKSQISEFSNGDLSQYPEYGSLLTSLAAIKFKIKK
eukprot:NODE_402_length_9320_cov_0.440252.p3 type:complete len:291 gc:universal NODE_402_length_9320_cov_0.440252:6743-5871(-)